MKGRVLLALSLMLNLGLLGWLGIRLTPHSEPPPVAKVATQMRPPPKLDPSPPPATSAAARPPAVRWSELESDDYAAYIANLRRIGCPEQTIRDIVLAALEKWYQSRIDASQPTNSGLFWRTAEQREKSQRASNQRERELNREKRAMIKRLLGLDYDQAVLEAWWDQPEFALALNFLPEPKPLEVIAAVNRFGEEDNEIDERAGGILTPEDVASKRKCFNQFLAELCQQLTPSELEEAKLRSFGAFGFGLDEDQAAGLKLTGVEVRELIRLKWQWDSPLEEALEWPDEAFEEARRRGQEQFVTLARKLVGDDRIAVVLLQEDSEFKPIHELAERQNLSNSTALEAYAIMKLTTDEITRVRRNRALSAGVRRAQIQDIRQSAGQALGRILGDRGLTDYLEQDAARWLASPGNR